MVPVEPFGDGVDVLPVPQTLDQRGPVGPDLVLVLIRAAAFTVTALPRKSMFSW